MKPKLILRADGNSQIGFGHLYRLLALADILKEQYRLVFVLYRSGDFVEKEIGKYADEIIFLKGELPFKTPDEILAGEEIDFDLHNILTGDETVVLDGYYFGTSYQQAVIQKNCKLVCIDDLAVNHFYADAVINHAPGIEKSRYKAEPYTRLYTGIEYAILRKPFFKPFTATYRNNENVFISLGGSDQFEITAKIASLLMDIKTFHTIHVLCSSSFPEKMLTLLEIMSRSTGKVRLYSNLSAGEIVNLMDSCQYAFVSASTVLMEAYARGLKCFTGYYTNNQLFIYDGFIKENRAIGLGNLKDLNAATIEKSMKNIGQLQNTCSAIEPEAKQQKNISDVFTFLNLELRAVKPQDIHLYHEWANDEIVRKNSINQHPIKWESHTEWFENKLISAYSKLFVLEYFKKPVGQVRIDLNDKGYWVINFSVERSVRGLGFGKKIIRLLIEKEPLLKYRAVVKKNNFPSNKAFEKNNFILKEGEFIAGEIYNVFEFSK